MGLLTTFLPDGLCHFKTCGEYIPKDILKATCTNFLILKNGRDMTSIKKVQSLKIKKQGNREENKNNIITYFNQLIEKDKLKRSKRTS